MTTPRLVVLNPWDRAIGPNRFLVELLRHAPELAARATIVFDAPSDAEDEYRALGCAVEHWPEIAAVHPRANVANLLVQARAHTAGLVRVVARLRALGADLLVTNTETVLVGGLAARALGVPHAQVFHAISFEYRAGRAGAILRSAARLVARLADRVIAVSTTLAGALERAGVPSGKIVTVPNPLPVDAIVAAAATSLPADLQAALVGGGPILVAAGRLSPVKGQDLLVEALPRIALEHPRALLDRVAALGLADHVRLVGEVANLPALLARAAVVVSPSRSESFSRVVAEALLVGTPVAAFACGAVPEVAGGGAALAPPEDSAALATAVLALLADPTAAARQAAIGRAHVIREYAAPAVAARFVALTQQLARRAAA